MDRGAWWAGVHGVSRSRTRLSDLAAAAAALPRQCQIVPWLRHAVCGSTRLVALKLTIFYQRSFPSYFTLFEIGLCLTVHAIL